VDSVVTEARQLVAEGVKELNLISQDSTFFGMDTWDQRPNPRTPVDSSRGAALTTLAQAIAGYRRRILDPPPVHAPRPLERRAHPHDMPPARKSPRYVDMPLQHISEPMLAAMQRETVMTRHSRSVRRIRAGIPGSPCARPSSWGFPAETEADVEELCDFIRETRFERLGGVPLLPGGRNKAASWRTKFSRRRRNGAGIG